jgi:hypothetical protein
MTKAIHRAVVTGLDVPGRFWTALSDEGADVLVTRKGRQSEPRDLVWELLLGALCHRVANEVRFEEPDVTCTLGGRRIAIAAKVAYSSRNIWSNPVDKGMLQAQGRGDVGLVAVNMVSILPLRQWLVTCERRRFRPGVRVAQWASRKAHRWCEDAGAENATTDIAHRLRTPDREPMPSGVVFFMPVIVAVDQ